MAAYRFSGYWKDVGTLESLWDANMDMLPGVGPGPAGRVLAHLRPVRQRAAGLFGPPLPDQPQCLQPGQRSGGGTVENSVLAPNVTVGEGARVSYSVLFPG